MPLGPSTIVAGALTFGTGEPGGDVTNVTVAADTSIGLLFASSNCTVIAGRVSDARI